MLFYFVNFFNEIPYLPRAMHSTSLAYLFNVLHLRLKAISFQKLAFLPSPTYGMQIGYGCSLWAQETIVQTKMWLKHY